VGELTGFLSPMGECVDAAGDVFIVAAASGSYTSSVIYEYPHGGTEPIAILSDPAPGGACAIDKTTGNLAVSGGAGSHAALAIYANAQGNPTMYYSSGYDPLDFCGYDDQGNLYVDAPDPHGGQDEVLVRVSTISGSFEQINLDTKFYGTLPPPSVQWDGRHMTVTSEPEFRGPLFVYRLSISGASGKVVGTTQLSSKKNNYMGQTWIQDKTFLAINVYRRGRRTETSIWKYPKGGAPRHSIRLASGGEFRGSAVSPAETGRAQ
jgi:hypothetical protein